MRATADVGARPHRTERDQPLLVKELPPSHARAGQRICERHATTADMYAKKAHIGRMKDPLLQNTHGYPIRPTARTILSQNDEFLPPFAIFGDRNLCHHGARPNLGNTREIGPLRGAARGCLLRRAVELALAS
jgi:hypothetical protein